MPSTSYWYGFTLKHWAGKCWPHRGASMDYIKLCVKTKRKYKKLLNWLAGRSFLIALYIYGKPVHVCQATTSSFMHLCVCMCAICMLMCVWICIHASSNISGCMCVHTGVQSCVCTRMWRPEAAVGIVLTCSPLSVLRCGLSVKPRAFGCRFSS